MSWTKRAKNLSTLTERAKNLLYYFWGTDDDEYVVDHLDRKIIFFDYGYTYSTKNTSAYTNRSKS